MFLLDTVVISELRKPLRQRNPNLVNWIEAVSSQDLFVSVVTIGEIERGIERQRQLDPQFAASLAAWLDVVLRTYEGRILPVDIAVARRWGRLCGGAGGRDFGGGGGQRRSRGGGRFAGGGLGQRFCAKFEG